MTSRELNLVESNWYKTKHIMKIGVIGAGNWGKNIVNNLRDLGALSGVADAVEENRQRAEESSPGIETFDNHDDLIDAGYDAVAIATPAHTHFDIAKQAMLKGLDVFVEKPMTLGASDAEALCEIAQSEGRILMVGHLLLYQPAISYIKEALVSGDIGKVFTMHQRRSKLGRARAVENTLWSFGVHDVAVLLYLSGQSPCGVNVAGHCGLQPNVEDDTYLHLNFPDGSMAHLHNSWLWPRVERGLVIVGEKGMLVYDEVAQTVSLAKKTIDADLQNVDQGEEVVFEGSGQPLKIELEHFIDSCQTRNTPKSSGQNGLDVVSVLEQAENILRPQN